ncbi:hypothetical protein JKP88DRAFT_307231 [Tribonema minus]|uniref:Uncharacterized protein n=1 Tax=Tribonema minus TaxID=303371 RepID=A0A836CIQ7_9STRA|nr:hypothetical protein JKP88DRAFT_307231 [Tribonema minus]
MRADFIAGLHLLLLSESPASLPASLLSPTSKPPLQAPPASVFASLSRLLLSATSWLTQRLSALASTSSEWMLWSSPLQSSSPAPAFNASPSPPSTTPARAMLWPLPLAARTGGCGAPEFEDHGPQFFSNPSVMFTRNHAMAAAAWARRPTCRSPSAACHVLQGQGHRQRQRRRTDQPIRAPQVKINRDNVEVASVTDDR